MDTTTATTAPDLTGYRLVHQALRWGSRNLAAGYGSLAPVDDARGAALDRWCAGFVEELHVHHTIEDDVAFPALVARVPVAAELIARTDADHATMDGLMARITAALVARSGSADAAQDAAADLAGAFGDLATLMTTHLDFEDAEVLPLFERHFSVEEWDEIDTAARKAIGVSKQALFTIPMVSSMTTDEEHAKLSVEAPLPVRIILRLGRKRYARWTEAAFGPAAAELRL